MTLWCTQCDKTLCEYQVAEDDRKNRNFDKKVRRRKHNQWHILANVCGAPLFLSTPLIIIIIAIAYAVWRQSYLIAFVKYFIFAIMQCVWTEPQNNRRVIFQVILSAGRDMHEPRTLRHKNRHTQHIKCTHTHTHSFVPLRLIPIKRIHK